MTSDPAGHHIPIGSVQNQLVRALVAIGTEIEAAGHSWHCEQLVPSAIQFMNNAPKLGKQWKWKNNCIYS